MLSNYTNLSANDYVKYQILFYDFPADEPVLPQNFRLGVACTAALLHPDIEAHADDPAYVYPIKFDGGVDPEDDAYTSFSTRALSIRDVFAERRSMNCEELAYYINQALKEFSVAAITDPLVEYDTTQAERLLLLLLENFVNFTYDTRSNKYVLDMKKNKLTLNSTFPVPEGTIFPDAPARTTFDGYIVGQYEFIFFADMRNNIMHTPQQIKQINAICAMQPNTLDLPSQPESNTASLRFAFPIEQVITQSTSFEDPIYTKFNQDLSDMIHSYSARCPRMFYNDYVYVRSSAATSLWDNTSNRKTDILAVLPRTRNFGGAAVINHTVHLQTINDIMVNDVLTSMRNMRLWLTDEDGDALIFENNFHLRLLIKFV